MSWYPQPQIYSMIFKTNKNGITIGGKTVDEISEDFDKLSNYISEKASKISSNLSVVQDKINSKNTPSTWSYDELPNSNISNLNKENYSIADKIREQNEYNELLKNENSSIEAAIELSKRRAKNYDETLPKLTEINNEYEKQRQLELEDKYNSTIKERNNEYDKYLSNLNTEVEESKKVQDSIENISPDTLEELGYKQKGYLKEIREEQQQFSDALTRVDTASVESLLPKKEDVKGYYDELLAEQREFQSQLNAIETTPIDSLKRDQYSEILSEQADGQMALNLSATEYNDTLSTQNDLSNQRVLTLSEETDGQMALIMAENEGVSAKQKDIAETTSQIVAKEALVEASNKELLSNVNEKLAKTGVTSATEELTIAKLREIAASNEEGSALAKETLKMLGLGEASKATSIAIKGLALAGNMVVGILAGFVISKAIEGLDNLVHAADNAKESAEGFASSFSSMNDEFSSNDSKLSDLQKQYDELSNGVNSLGENVSLTTDQYDEYKQVVSKISDMMPSLLARYDDEGKKIGFVQGKLSDLNAEYDKYKKNKAMDLVNGENDNGDSIKDVFDNYQYQTAHTDVNGNVVGKRKMFGDSNYEKILALQSEIDSGYDGIFGQNKLTNEDIEKKTALIQKYQSEIDASVSAIQNALSAIAQSGDEYYKLSDQEQQFLDTYINSLSQDFIDENNLTNETNARTFINNLINDIESGKPEIMKAYNDLFSFNIDDTDLSPEEVQKKVNELIQQLAKALGEDNWQDLKIRLGFEFVDDNVKDYDAAINRFKSSEEANIEELKQSYQEAIDKRKELYSGENYVGNVDINNRPVVINDDGSYSTTSTSFQEKWVGDEENGHYIIAHFTPILPDGTVLDEDSLNEYIDKILNSDDPMEADKVENGGKGIVYKVDTEINGKEIKDDNLEDAFGVADAWDVDMHNLQDKMYQDEAKIKGQIAQFGNDVDGSQKIKDFFDTEGINTDEEINEFNEVTKGVNDADLAIQKWNEHKKESNETDISLPDTETLKQQISDLNSAIDSIQSAYDTLNSAVEEYNSNGGTLSIDTIQSLLSLSNEYLACLQVENGQLSLNADAMNALAQAKLDEAQATAVTQAMTELQAIANGEAAQSTTNYISGNAALMSSLAQLSGSYEGVAQAAMTAAQAQKLSAFISNASAKDKTATENVMKGLDTKLKLIQSTQNKIKSSGISFSKKSSASKAASKSAEKTMEDIQKQWKEYLDKYLAMYKAELDAGLIDFNTFLNKSRSLLDEYYRDGKISAKDYWDSVKSLYENQLSIYDKVLSAVTRRIEKEVDGIQDIIDGLEKQNDALQKQLDEYDSILSVVDEVYEKQIQALEDEKGLLQDKIDAINDTNDALDLQYRKEQAIIALKRAQEQRTKKVFNGKEFIFTTDQNAVRDAQQTLQDIKTEELINNLEKEQEGIDAEIEKLQEYKEKWQEITSAKETEQNKQLAIALWGQDYERFILQNRISDIENFKNNYVSIQKQIENNQGLIESYNQKVDYYNKLKEQWTSITDAYKQAQEDQYATMVLGAQWESNVLNSRLDTLNKFKNEYIAIQQQIVNAALEAARAVQVSTTQANSSLGGGNYSNNMPVSTPQSTPTKYFHVVQKVSSGYSSEKNAEEKIDRYNGDGVLWDGSNNKWYVYKNKNYSSTPFKTYSDAINSDIYKKAGRLKAVAYYASGTSNAKKGLNIVGEAGTETYIDNDGNVSLVTKPTLIPMEGGETVINASETKKILANMDNLIPLQDYDNPLSGLNLRPIDYSSMVMSNMKLPDYSKFAVNRGESTTISIGDIHLHEVNNVDSLANAIIRELPSKISQKLGQ